MPHLLAALALLILAFAGRPAAAEEQVSPNVEQVRAIAQKEAAAGSKTAQAYLDALNGSNDQERNALGGMWLIDAANRGIPEAQFQLGLALELKKAPELPAAAMWYRKSAEQRYAPAQSRLGALHAEGKGVPKDSKLAVDWTLRGAEGGDVDAQARLGAWYWQGKHVEQDAAAAARWLERAAMQGNTMAGMLLIGVLQHPSNAERDPDKAQYWLKRLTGIEPKAAGAEPQTATSENTNDPARLIAAAESGSVGAQSRLGLNYATGRGGVEKDFAKAAHWWGKAAAQGNSYAQTKLGILHAGGHGVAQDDVEALKWYQLAAAQGNAEAEALLGNFHRRGRGGLPVDEAEAVRLYRLAADKGNAMGLSRLGYMYETGSGGLARDRAAAVGLYRRAAEKGDRYAKERLEKLEPSAGKKR